MGRWTGGSGGLASLADAWRAALADELPSAEELRRNLHAEPRVSGDESGTARALEEALAGVLTLTPVAEAGRWGRLGPEGPSVGLRAELDALPMREQTGVVWASRLPAMHACGHDVHMAALVGLLRAAARLPDGSLPAGLVAVFQPREEAYPSGGADVAGSGLLASQDVRAMIAAHVHHQVPLGRVATGTGPINAASDHFHVRVIGRGGHGAYPYESADPVPALAVIASGLPGVLRATVPPLRPAVISIGTLRAGDGAANVIPDEGFLLASLRTHDPRDRALLADRLIRFAEDTARGFGVRAEASVERGEPALSNDVELAAGADAWLRSWGIEETEPMRSMGSDDFSYYTEILPGLMCFAGVHPEPDAAAPGLHDPRFLPPDRTVGDVATALVAGYLGAVERVLWARGGAT